MRKIILEYHMVDEVNHDYNNINIYPDYFEQQICYLKEHCQIVSYEDLLFGEAGNGTQIAISFDDVFTGFKDIVYPVITQYQIPVILFLTEKYTMLHREFWMNELMRLLLEEKNHEREFLFRHPMYQYKFSTASFREREAVYNSLKFILGGMDELGRENCMEQIRSWASVDDGDREEYLPLSIDFCRTIKSDPLISFGSHTVSHGFLGEMTYEEQYGEISRSKHFLESVLDREIQHFAYPFGSYNNTTKDILRKLNFKSACSSKKGWWEDQKTDFLELPRLVPPNTGKKGFDRWIRMLCNEKKETIDNEFIVYIGKLEGDKKAYGRERKCVIFGAGVFGEILLCRMQQLEIQTDLIGFVDNDVHKQGEMFHEYPVFPVDLLKDGEYEVYIWHYSRTILAQLKEMNVRNIHLITGV